jgi:peptide/nickel transport system permease protein
MLEVLDAEYVKLARAKGLSERRVIWRHAFRNALLPVVGFAGIFFINIVTLSIVVEVVYSWPGLGQLTCNAILTRDYPMIQGVVLLAGVITIVGNAVVDVLYGLLDPRARSAPAV